MSSGAAPKLNWPSTPFKVPVEEADLIALGLKWETFRGTCPDKHPTAVRGGRDAQGKPLYIARVKHEGNILFGKAGSMLAGAAFSWHLKEIMMTRYELLTAHPDVQKRLKWVPVKPGPLMNLAGVFCGGCRLARNNARVFCGRRNVGNSVHPGYVYSEKEMDGISMDGISIGFDGHEIHDIHVPFEVLVVGSLPHEIPAEPKPSELEMASLDVLEQREDEHDDAVRGTS
jgi:hypothetical protein